MGDTPNSPVAIFDFGDKTIVCETRGLKSAPFHPEIKAMWFFYGSEGIVAETGLYDPEGKLIEAFEGTSVNHFANFLEAVRTRKREDLRAEILEGHQSSALCHLANISYRLGTRASVEEIRSRLGEAETNAEAREDLERTRHYLAEAGVDLEKTPMTLGRRLLLDGGKEKFLDDPEADALLTREYRAPFVVAGA